MDQTKYTFKVIIKQINLINTNNLTINSSDEQINNKEKIVIKNGKKGRKKNKTRYKTNVKVMIERK